MGRTFAVNMPQCKSRVGAASEPAMGKELLECMKQSKMQALHYSIRRQVRADRLPYYYWRVTDGEGWTLASGTVYGDQSEAIERARGAMAALSNDPWRGRELLH
jgi:hypothetical protein